MLSFVKADIALHRCDAIFFTRPEDWPERFHSSIPPDLLAAQAKVPEWIAAMKERVTTTDPEQASKILWEPGRLYLWKGPSKKVLFPCLGENPDYGVFRDCLQRLKATFLKLGIRSIAMPRIGTGWEELEWSVIRSMLVLFFAEPNPPAGTTPQTLYVEVYEDDVPGKAHE